MAIGLALKHARVRSGLSQADAAERAGVTQQNWSKLEKGGQSIDIVALNGYARAVGMDRDDLLREADLIRGEQPKGAANDQRRQAEPSPDAFEIPVWGRARGGPRGAHVYDLMEPERYLNLRALYGPTSRAMRLVGDSVYPWAASGTTIVYDMDLWPRKDEGCVIETLEGEYYVKIFERVDDDVLVVKELQPEPRLIEFQRADLRGVYCVTDRIDRAR